MLTKFSVALFLYTKNRSYGKLLNFANAIHAGLTATAATYPTPSPTLITLAGQITALSDSMAAWNEGAGTHTDLLTLQGAASDLRESLRELAIYVQGQTPNDVTAWASAGFEAKANSTPIGSLAAVQNLHQYISDKVPVDSIRLRWKKPLGSERAKDIMYRVLYSDSSSPAEARQIAITSKTFVQHQPLNLFGAYYWIIPINTDGSDGVMSDGCFANPKRVTL